jgi:hypothetical protein
LCWQDCRPNLMPHPSSWSDRLRARTTGRCQRR